MKKICWREIISHRQHNLAKRNVFFWRQQNMFHEEHEAHKRWWFGLVSRAGGSKSKCVLLKTSILSSYLLKTGAPLAHMVEARGRKKCSVRKKYKIPLYLDCYSYLSGKGLKLWNIYFFLKNVQQRKCVFW